MPSERAAASALLPCVLEQRLIDHHCHGVLREGGDLETLLTEGDGGAAAGGTAYDSLAGLAFRRMCPPVLGLPPHAPLAEYAARRSSLGAAEVSGRFLAAAGLGALCLDTGFQPRALLSPAEMGALAGAPAYEVVRLEQVGEDVGAVGVSAYAFADAFRTALEERAAAAGPRVVAVKSIAAYRVGLGLGAERPPDAEVAAAAGRWMRGGTGNGSGGSGAPPRLADETLHRFFIWCGADLGLPVQFHVG
ncbi:MAG: amidohydrolase, partial [Streptosporangiaceae bacterium]|nr:amidohydrolase [Streptosporangiaceae bacterium]